MYIAFDTETTAGVPFSSIRNTDYTDNAWKDVYIGQIAWTCISDDGDILESNSVKIRPYRNGIRIPVENPFAPSISESSLIEDGVDESFLIDFARKCLDAKCIVAHNAWFDINLLCKEIKDDSYLPSKLFSHPKWCTMDKASSRDGWEKWPTMSEISETIGITLEHHRLHDAVYDTELCAKVFLEQSRRSVPPPGKLYTPKKAKGLVYDKYRRMYWYYNVPSNIVKFGQQ